MKILLILLLLISPAHFDNPPPVSWPTSLHQKVIVQATSLMPESIARRILIHRKDILRGCVDTLKKELTTVKSLPILNCHIIGLQLCLEAKILISG